MDETSAKAEVRISPQFSGDGYGYGGGAVLCIGRFAIPFGEHPEALFLAEQLADAWNCRTALTRNGGPENG